MPDTIEPAATWERVAPVAPAQAVGGRAGLFRRGLALSIDSLIISVLFQAIVAVLFVATSGRIQIYGDLVYKGCAVDKTIPEGLVPPPPVGANAARECNIYFLGAQTARTLHVGPRAKDGEPASTASQGYMLDRDGHPIDGVAVDWIAMLALIVYVVVMETRTGATLGKRAMGIRVIDAAAPDACGVPLRKVAMRYLAMLIGFLPILAGLLVYFGMFGSLGEAHALIVKLSRASLFDNEVGSQIYSASRAVHWHPVLAAYWLELPGILQGAGAPSLDAVEWLLDAGSLVLKGWALLLAVQIARKRDPLYDRWAGTAVVLDS